MSSNLILASQSPRRQALLRALGLEFEVRSSDVEELTHSDQGPQALAMENARLKADDIAQKASRDWVIGSDTVVALGDRVFGKPGSRADAEAMLAELQGQTHQVFSGVCLQNREQTVAEMWCGETLVSFRSLSRSQIEFYLDQMNPLDKAGAYAIQEGGEYIISRVEGSLSNVVGLPLDSLEERLRKYQIL